MTKNYFAIERGNQFWDHVMLANLDGTPVFEDFLDMTYEEMKSNEKLSDFVNAAMDAANRQTDSDDDQTAVTLIDENDVFIWGIIIGVDDDDMLRYCLVDWQKDGQKYRYEV